MRLAWIAPPIVCDKWRRVLAWFGILLAVFLGAITVGLVNLAPGSCFTVITFNPEHPFWQLITLQRAAGWVFIVGTMVFQLGLTRGRMIWPISLMSTMAVVLVVVAWFDGIVSEGFGREYYDYFVVRIVHPSVCREDRDEVTGTVVFVCSAAAIYLNSIPLPGALEKEVR